jgi:predicted enzyme related to lactoylglutathione lyase/mannose-6-phosphate isomerase-like protein (cupin superfamily)
VGQRLWVKATLEKIPSSAEIPVPGLELTPEQEEQAVRERAPRASSTWDKAARKYGRITRRTHAVRRYLGIESFGCNAWEADAGEMLVPEHDEVPYGQEELFLVVKGRARFTCDGDDVELGPGELLYAKPEVVREAFALETPTLLFLVGGVPGKAYEPPVWSRDWRPRTEGGHPVFRSAGISYLRIPAPDPHAAADFYERVFGWTVRRDRDEPAFEDGTGHVIGHFDPAHDVAGEAGVRPYVFVESVDQTLTRAEANGAEVVTAPYPEGDLVIAVIRDPLGNVVGIWQGGT